MAPKKTSSAFCASCWGALVLLLHFAASASAAPYWDWPCHDRCACVPNAREYGYFRTLWRQWPDESRPNQDFPQSIGLEQIPVPPTRAPLPLSAPAQVPQITPPSSKGTLPPGVGFKIDQVTPEVPAEPIPSDMEPIIPEAFPGIAEPPLGEPEVPAEPQPPAEVPAEPPIIAPPEADLPDAFPGLSPGFESSSQRVPGERTGDGRTGGEQAAAEDLPQQPAAKKVAEKADNRAEKRPEASQAKVQPIRANWIAALNPGFRGHSGGPTTEHRATLTDRAGALHHPEPQTPAATAQDRGQPQQPETRPVSHAEVAPQRKITPMALDGYCPVELLTKERWTLGDPCCSTLWRGRVYLFAGPDQKQQFLDDRQRYAPAGDGLDPVLVVDGNRRIPGRIEHCAIYNGRLYIFSSRQTMQKFRANSQRYVNALKPLVRDFLDEQ